MGASRHYAGAWPGRVLEDPGCGHAYPHAGAFEDFSPGHPDHLACSGRFGHAFSADAVEMVQRAYEDHTVANSRIGHADLAERIGRQELKLWARLHHADSAFFA